MSVSSMRMEHRQPCFMLGVESARSDRAKRALRGLLPILAIDVEDIAERRLLELRRERAVSDSAQAMCERISYSGNPLLTESG